MASFADTELKQPAKVIKDNVQIMALSTSYQSFRDDLHGHLTRGESSSLETRRGVKACLLFLKLS